ncbi:MAG: hypothetical protein ACR2P0_15645 [Acidimicrobiales bacterium]
MSMAVTNMATLEAEIATGVDVVADAQDQALADRVLTPATLRLIGSLHRRLWDRRSTILRDRAIGQRTGGPSVAESWVVDPFDPPAELHRGADLRGGEGSSWDTRLHALAQTFEASADAGVALVRVRGWEQTESAILVDGRAVPGAIVDLVLLLSQNAETLRGTGIFTPGETRFWVCAPNIPDRAEARLWNDLLNLVQDRLGIDRGTMRLVVSTGSPASFAELDDVLFEVRAHAAGLCMADESGVDDISVKELAARRGVVVA